MQFSNFESKQYYFEICILNSIQVNFSLFLLSKITSQKEMESNFFPPDFDYFRYFCMCVKIRLFHHHE